MPGIGITPTENPVKEQVEKAIQTARKSTASVGKFTDKLPEEKTRGKHLGKKRKVGHTKSSVYLLEKKMQDLPVYRVCTSKKLVKLLITLIKKIGQRFCSKV